jgi:hypothetical protein
VRTQPPLTNFTFAASLPTTLATATNADLVNQQTEVILPERNAVNWPLFALAGLLGVLSLLVLLWPSRKPFS